VSVCVCVCVALCVYHLTKDPVCIPQHGAAQEDVVIINRNVLLPRAHQFAAEGVEPVVGRLELEHSAECGDFGWGIKIPRRAGGASGGSFKWGMELRIFRFVSPSRLHVSM